MLNSRHHMKYNVICIYIILYFPVKIIILFFFSLWGCFFLYIYLGITEKRKLTLLRRSFFPFPFRYSFQEIQNYSQFSQSITIRLKSTVKFEYAPTHSSTTSPGNCVTAIIYEYKIQ